jgi:hypothetical protein
MGVKIFNLKINNKKNKAVNAPKSTANFLEPGGDGLDHYEVTRYRGWYHHITLSMMALTFLKTVQREWQKKTLISVPEIRRILELYLPRTHWDSESVLRWFRQQQKRKEDARRSHTKRWLKEHGPHPPPPEPI